MPTCEICALKHTPIKTSDIEEEHERERQAVIQKFKDYEKQIIEQLNQKIRNALGQPEIVIKEQQSSENLAKEFVEETKNYAEISERERKEFFEAQISEILQQHDLPNKHWKDLLNQLSLMQKIYKSYTAVVGEKAVEEAEGEVVITQLPIIQQEAPVIHTQSIADKMSMRLEKKR